MSTDESYMRRALQLAEKARGRTSPNPMVGAVIVKAGEPHAEVEHSGKQVVGLEGSSLRQDCLAPASMPILIT